MILILILISHPFRMYAQKIEFKKSIKGVEKVHRSVIATFEESFILVTKYEIQYYDANKGILNNRNWSDIAFKELEYTEKKKKNTIILQSPFNPVSVRRTQNGFSVLVLYKPEKGSSKLLEYKFDNELKLTGEILITTISLPDNKKMVYSIDCTKSDKTDFYIFSMITKGESTGGQSVRSFEYFALDAEYNIYMKGKMSLPERKPNSDYSYNTPQKTIMILEEGDPLMNVNGELYLVNKDELLKLEVTPEKTVDSYVLLQNKRKDLVIVGTYNEIVGNKKMTGYVVLRYDQNLSFISGDYNLFEDNFQLTPSELINTGNYGGQTSKKFGVTHNMNFQGRCPASVIEAHLNDDGSIFAAFVGCAGYKEQDAILKIPQNISFLVLNNDNTIKKQVTFPYEFGQYPNYEFQKFRMQFTENSMILIGADYSVNFDSDRNYKPSMEKIQYINSDISTFSIALNLDNDEITRKGLSLKTEKRTYNRPILLPTINMTTTPIVLELIAEDETAYGIFNYD